MRTTALFIVLSFLTIFFQNCAKPSDVMNAFHVPDFTTDPEFAPFIRDFEVLYKRSTSEIPIGFADLGPGLAGVCYRTAVGGQIVAAFIKIDKAVWPTMSRYQQMNLIFHELGHCALNRNHTPVNSVLVCPVSLMHPQVLTTECLKQHLAEYIDELFQ